jgi:tRNA A-37 threonylcarbamoyl transferase component Bud32
MAEKDTIRKCSRCGSAAIGDEPAGLCPRCLLALNLEPDTEAARDELGPNGTRIAKPMPHVPLSLGEVAKCFPHLEILECLGRGGMGVVYKARQPRLDRIVALKILAPEREGDSHFAERFEREAKALARMSHSNIVAIYDFGESGGLFYLMMEFVDGLNLRQLLRRGQVASGEALAIVPKICEALQYAHEQGIVHRDIKPENELLDKQGRVKIADFGLAKIVGRESTDPRTEEGLVVGTPRYMAPEQMERPETVDHRSDIYSLGVVFYELLTGELPLGRFALPSQKQKLDVRLDEVVLKALEKRPERRYQQANEIKTDVETISGIIERLPPKLQKAFGYEYRSKASLFGLPWLHINAGYDPVSGKRRVAKGIFAFGDRAIGVVAVGRIAQGAVAFGGLAIGIVALGGCSVGLLTAGGIGVGLLISWAAISIAFVAMGGLAMGYYALGGAPFGIHALGRFTHDPIASTFFSSWAWLFPRLILLNFVLLVSGLASFFFLPKIVARMSKAKPRST